MVFEKIVHLAKKHRWKGQVCGLTGICGSVGTNLHKDGKVLSVSIVEEGHMTFPDDDEIKDLFDEK